MMDEKVSKYMVNVVDSMLKNKISCDIISPV